MPVRNPWLFWVVGSLSGIIMPATATEIFRCEGPEGVTSYQQSPCPKSPPAAEIEPETQPLPAAPPANAEARPDPEMVAACKKRYRDEIDRIDAEMREGFAPDEREAYREKLRALSQQLNRCDYVSDDTTGRSEGPQPSRGDL